MAKKVVAVKFNLEQESERRCYEELLKLDGGAYATPSGYAKAILVHYLQGQIKKQESEIDYQLLAEKVAEILKAKSESWEVPEGSYYDQIFG